MLSTAWLLRRGRRGLLLCWSLFLWRAGCFSRVAALVLGARDSEMGGSTGFGILADFYETLGDSSRGWSFPAIVRPCSRDFFSIDFEIVLVVMLVLLMKESRAAMGIAREARIHWGQELRR